MKFVRMKIDIPDFDLRAGERYSTRAWDDNDDGRVELVTGNDGSGAVVMIDDVIVIETCDRCVQKSDDLRRLMDWLICPACDAKREGGTDDGQNETDQGQDEGAPGQVQSGSRGRAEPAADPERASSLAALLELRRYP